MKMYQKLFVLIVVLSHTRCTNLNKDPTKEIRVIELKEDGCSIYLKHVVWGLTGDNSITYIGSTKELKDTIREPYLRTIDFFYALKTDCSLHIYKSDTLRREHLSTVKIIFDGDEDINYSNYKQKGFDNILYQ